MTTINDLVAEAISDFTKVSALAHTEFSAESMTVEISAKPHQGPRTLPIGKMAVYAFFLNGQACSGRVIY